MDLVSAAAHVRGGGTACASGDGHDGVQEKKMSKDGEDGMEEALLEALLDEEDSSMQGRGGETLKESGMDEHRGRRRRRRPSLKRTRVDQKKDQGVASQRARTQRDASSSVQEEGGDGGGQCLTHLPVDCLERIVARLSPNALCHLAQTCRLCRSLASSASLWKALYYTRWPYGLLEGEEGIKKEDWKQLYMERDAEEMKNAMGAAQEDGHAQLYSQMTLACREYSLNNEHADATLCMATGTMCVPGSLRDHVYKFKEYHGIEEFRSGDDRGVCSCEYVRLTGHHWICRQCGTMHACGDMCDERDRCVGDEMLVCRLTGCCFRDMVDDVDAAENADEVPEVGRLGRAFLAGYHASSRREMFMKFGVSID